LPAPIRRCFTTLWMALRVLRPQSRCLRWMKATNLFATIWKHTLADSFA